MQIDAVLLWVDGNDPVLTAKRSKYAPADALKMSDVAGATRYANVGEIFWCIASLNRFASFLHKIYIITDGQDPHLDPFLEKNFPSGHIPYEIVDHKTIFKGYEEYLPVFNSTSIETMENSGAQRAFHSSERRFRAAEAMFSVRFLYSGRRSDLLRGTVLRSVGEADGQAEESEDRT